jgi:hypothetical protein
MMMTAHGFDGGCRGLCITNKRLRAVPPGKTIGVDDPAANDSLRQGRGSEMVLQLIKNKAMQRRPSRQKGNNLGLWII